MTVRTEGLPVGWFPEARLIRRGWNDVIGVRRRDQALLVMLEWIDTDGMSFQVALAALLPA